MEPIVEYDDRGNLIYYKNLTDYEYWQGYDENNNLIYFKDSICGESSLEYYYKWEDDKKIRITQQEFEQIKKDKEYKEFISREEVSIFELLDI